MKKIARRNLKASRTRSTFEIYDNTVSVLNVLFLKISSDYYAGKIKTPEEFDKAFLKYYAVLSSNSEDFISLPDDWCAGVGNNCTGKVDVYENLQKENIENENSLFSDNSDMFGASDERFCELLTTLDTKDRLSRFMALSKNSSKINSVAHDVLTKFNTNHKYVTEEEYQEPVRKSEYMTEERKAIYDSIEKTFGKFACCATKSTLTLGNNKRSKVKKQGASNRVAFISNNVAISVKGYEDNKRSSFIDFICTIGADDTQLGRYEGIENELISYFDGEDLAELLNSDYQSLNRLKETDFRRLDLLLKPIAEHYHYRLHDRHLKTGDEMREEFVTDLWNLYSLEVGRMSKFKGVEDYMVCIAKVSPYDASQATLAKCYFNLCKEFRNDTIERVEYYDSVAVGAKF